MAESIIKLLAAAAQLARLLLAGICCVVHHATGFLWQALRER